MWIARETLRLVERAVFGALVALVLAELRVLSAGDVGFTRAFSVSLLIVGCLLLVYGIGASDPSRERRLSPVGRYWNRPNAGRELTAGAVSVVSGAVLVALGMTL